MSRLPRESPEKRGHFLPSEVSGLWYMEVGRGSGRRRDRERGRWLQECDPESRPWPRGFPERFLPLPVTLLSLSCRLPPSLPTSCLSSPLPSPDRPFSQDPVTNAPVQPSLPRPSSSGFRFPHLMWGNPRTGTSPPSCPSTLRLRLFVPRQTHIFCSALLSWRCTQRAGPLVRPHPVCAVRDPLDPL